jgi:hypothetical protein
VPSCKGAFVWDDSKYIQDNPLIASLYFNAFSTYVMGQLSPANMLGYAIQYKFVGLSTAGYASGLSVLQNVEFPCDRHLTRAGNKTRSKFALYLC